MNITGGSRQGDIVSPPPPPPFPAVKFHSVGSGLADTISVFFAIADLSSVLTQLFLCRISGLDLIQILRRAPHMAGHNTYGA